MPLNVLASYYNSEAYKRRIAKQEEKKAVSAPKLTRRKKALSLSDKNIRSAAQQLQSPFFKLPGELRTQIYEVFFGYRSGIHIVFWDGRLHSYRCQWTSDLAIPARHTQCWNNYCNGSWSQGSKQGWHDWKSDVMGLLRSCRIMYTETIPFLYSRPTFMFHDYASFLAFVASILPSRIQTIQSVCINQPEGTSPIVSGFNDLGDHFHHSSLYGPSSYSVLHTSNISVRNPILISLVSATRSQEPEIRIGAWLHIIHILSNMKALNEVRVHLYLSIIYDREFEQQEEWMKKRTWERFLTELDQLKKGREWDEWNVFDITIDRLPRGFGAKHVDIVRKRMMRC